MGDSILANSTMEFYVFDPIVCDGFSNPLRKRDREQKNNRSIGKNCKKRSGKCSPMAIGFLFLLVCEQKREEDISYGLLEANFIYVHQFSKRMAIKHY